MSLLPTRFEIEQRLGEMRSEMKHRIVEYRKETGQLEECNSLPEDIHIALCGKCHYTDEIKQYHEQSFYPFCECIDCYDFELVKCKFGEKDHHGQEISGTLIYRLDEHKDIKHCPQGYKLKKNSCI